MPSVLDEVSALARVQRGKLHIQHQKQFDTLVAQLNPSWQLEVTVKRLRATRSTQANRYYWGVVLAAIGEYTGYSPEELHEVLKAKFLPKHLAFSDGNGEVVEEYVLGGSTRKLNTAEFAQYVKQIQVWAASARAVWPCPDALVTDPAGPLVPKAKRADLSNLLLICGLCHSRVHRYEIIVTGDGNGTIRITKGIGA